MKKIVSNYEKQGSLSKPGPMGRVSRLLLGLVCLYFFVDLVSHRNWFIYSGTPKNIGFWFGLAIAFQVFPYVFNIGFSLSWGRRPQAIILILASVAMLWSFFQYGNLWGPPLGSLIVIWLIYVYGHLGISLVLASLISTPGCEMRAIPHLWTLLTGRETKEHYCPGLFDKIDKWEAERSQT